jgi:hypothetical protein
MGMKYLYGDATPFPLDENFIDTIGAAVDACVALFQADAEADSKRARAVQVQKIADEELRRLDVIGKAVQAALRPMLAEGKPERPAQAAAHRIVGTAGSTIKNARAGVVRRRDAAMRSAIGDQIGQRVFDAIEHFLLRHQLPRTQWSLRWTGGERPGDARAQALALTPSKLQTTFSIAIPDQRSWSGPMRLATLEPSLILKLQRSGGLLRRGPRISKVALHKLYITEIEISGTREGFLLRGSARKPSSGYRVVMFENDQSTPTITRIDAEGRTAGKPMTLAGDDAVALGRLWTSIHRAMYDLLRYRDRADTIRLGGHTPPADRRGAQHIDHVLVVRPRPVPVGDLAVRVDLDPVREHPPLQLLDRPLQRRPLGYLGHDVSAGIPEHRSVVGHLDREAALVNQPVVVTAHRVARFSSLVSPPFSQCSMW